ncbi:MAG: DUF4394 domain-containing protein [Verrucomicrobiota bacterium]
MKSNSSTLIQAFLSTTLLCVAVATSRGELVYGLSQNTLFSFDTANPSVIGGVHSISGLQGDNLISLDIRPATAQLYGLGSSLRLYTLDPNTGTASVVNPAAFGTPIGTSFSLSFVPAADTARVVGYAAQNFRVQPNGSPAGVDGNLAYEVNDPNFGQDPSVAGAAYNKTGGALLGIDSVRDALVRLDVPNSGVVKTVGLLGVNTTGNASLEISGVSGLAYASLTRPGDSSSGLYQVDLQTGEASFMGSIGFGSPLVGLAAQIQPIPEPSTWMLGLLGFIGLGINWRRNNGRAR